MTGTRVTRTGRHPGRAALAVAVLILATAVLLAGVLASSAPAVYSPASPVFTTTGPTPPPKVHPVKGNVAVSDATQTVISGVPAYIWRDGCGPTSVGMIAGYYDSHGFDDLISGSAATQTTAVSQAIASHNDGSGPRHYEDYSLPMDDGGPVVDDKSEAPSGDEHTSDCVADFMETSWSVNNSPYGSSWSNKVGPAFVSYVYSRLSGVTASYQNYYYSDGTSGLTFPLLQQEIDANRPMLFMVDCTGDGATDHAIAVIGYRESSGYPEYGFWDTWDASIQWARFRGLSSSYQWGVWGGTAFSLVGGGSPSPSPSPSPSAGDTTPPTSSVDGADSLWHPNPVSLILTASDAHPGVAYLETDVDNAGWTSFSSLPAELIVSGQGIHTIAYRAADLAGNVEATNTCFVKIDGSGPVTSARRASGRRGTRIALRYKVADLTPQARVKLVVKARSGRVRATVRLGLQGTGSFRSVRWRCKVARGVYRYFVYATDLAGNPQSTLGSARLVVR